MCYNLIMKKFISKNYFYIIYFIIYLYIIINGIFSLRSNDIGNTEIILFIFAITFVMLLFLFLKLKYSVINDKNIPKIFIVCSIVIGSIYLFASPLYTGSDEENHMYRAYEISDGIFKTNVNDGIVGSNLPRSMYDAYIESGGHKNINYDDISAMINKNIEGDKKIKYGFNWMSQYTNTSLYSPVQYIPQVIGFSIAKLFNFNVYFMGLMGRMVNLLFFCVLCYYGLKNIPRNKVFYMLLLLCPNIMNCATTLSCDGALIASIFLFLSIIYKTIYNKEKLNINNIILLSILVIFISASKIVYLPIIFSLFLLKKDNFKNKKNKYCILIPLVIIGVILNLLWLRCTNIYFETDYSNSFLQKDFIFDNIFRYLYIVIKTYISNGYIYLRDIFVGDLMYHGTLDIPDVISYIYLLIVLISLFDKKEKYIVKFSIFNIIASVIIIGLISTSLYVQCTAVYAKVGLDNIIGIQGRYFLPIMLLLPFTINKFKSIKISNNFYYYSLLIVNILVINYMMLEFII